MVTHAKLPENAVDRVYKLHDGQLSQVTQEHITN
jgi:hypothetical protein